MGEKTGQKHAHYIVPLMPAPRPQPDPQLLELASLGWSLANCFFQCRIQSRGVEDKCPIKAYTLNNRVYVSIYLHIFVYLCVCVLFNVYDC